MITSSTVSTMAVLFNWDGRLILGTRHPIGPRPDGRFLPLESFQHLALHKGRISVDRKRGISLDGTRRCVRVNSVEWLDCLILHENREMIRTACSLRAYGSTTISLLVLRPYMSRLTAINSSWRLIRSSAHSANDILANPTRRHLSER